MKLTTKKVLFIAGGILLITLFSLLTRLIIMNVERNSGTFVLKENHEHGDGRILQLNNLDRRFKAGVSPDIKWMPTVGNMYNTDHSHEMNSYDSITGKHAEYPLYVHRFTGRVDTLYTYRNQEVLGYVQRIHYSKRWLVLEVKNVGQILGYQYLAKEEYKKSPLDSLSIGCYTYEGQRIFFDAPFSHFWIASRTTTNLYGPLTEVELQTQLKRLNIPLPLTMEGKYDRYVYNYTEELDHDHFYKEKLPKEFHYPHWQERPDRIIQP